MIMRVNYAKSFVTEGADKHKNNQVLNYFFQEVPERKLSCDHSADKSLLVSMDDNDSAN